MRTILHVDMDAFFASVELLRHPELRGRPVVVGGEGARGVVAAATYEARAYGVYSALSSVRARRLCPNAVFLSGDYGHYAEVSGRIMTILKSFTPLVEPLSLDEAFLDVTGVLHDATDGVTIAADIRTRIRTEEGLECGIGVAPSKFIAKVASKEAKPKVGQPGRGPDPGRGIVVVSTQDTLRFLHRLPAGALWGVGPVTEKRLADIGVRTIGDLAALPLATLTRRVGKAAGVHLNQLANGIDDRPVVADQAPKSVGNEETFTSDHTSHETLLVELARLVDATTSHLRTRVLTGRTVTLKLRYADFRTVTRSATLDVPSASPRVIGRSARALLESLDVGAGVRLLGISMSGLKNDDGTRQLQLDMTTSARGTSESWTDAEEAVAAVRDRFGSDAIAPATLVSGAGIRVRHRGERQWGPGRSENDDSGRAGR